MMSWIKVTPAGGGKPDFVNADMCEQVRFAPNEISPPTAKATIILQSGKSVHVLETQGEVMKLIGLDDH
jgi:uncharacterized protein YlzI (FlbEa/FlbD family)